MQSHTQQWIDSKRLVASFDDPAFSFDGFDPRYGVSYGHLRQVGPTQGAQVVDQQEERQLGGVGVELHLGRVDWQGKVSTFSTNKVHGQAKEQNVCQIYNARGWCTWAHL